MFLSIYEVEYIIVRLWYIFWDIYNVLRFGRVVCVFIFLENFSIFLLLGNLK